MALFEDDVRPLWGGREIQLEVSLLRTSSVIPTFPSSDGSDIRICDGWRCTLNIFVSVPQRSTSIRARSTWARSVSWGHVDLARMFVMRSAQRRHVRQEEGRGALRFPRAQRSRSQVVCCVDTYRNNLAIFSAWELRSLCFSHEESYSASLREGIEDIGHRCD